VTVAAQTSPLPAPPDDLSLATRGALVALCALAEAIATAILLLDHSLPRPLNVVALVAALGITVLLLSILARGRPSRVWLCVAAAATVPLVGGALAIATLNTRGHASARIRRRRMPRRRPALTIAAMQRLADALPLCDALACGDREQRHAAMSALLLRGDREAIAVLRWAAAGQNPDLALSAALALDEFGKRAERKAARLECAEARHETG
jgi:hypothetical protein